MCPGLEFVTLAPSSLGLRDAPNLFVLPEDDRADVTLITANWYDWLRWEHPTRVGDVMRRIESHSDVTVGFDGYDMLDLRLPPAVVERLALVIKAQGLYRDRDFYNYQVGARYPGANWTEKVSPYPVRYRDRDLEKLRLSIPCFLIEQPPLRRRLRANESGPSRLLSRRMSRSERILRDLADVVLDRLIALSALGPRRRDVHCLGALTHVQRVEVMQILEPFAGTRGFTHLMEVVGGNAGVLLPDLSPELRRELADALSRYHHPKISRARFLLDLTRHQVVVSPTGDGEICFRHGEALRAGAALVCQDLSHVEMMFPLSHEENAVFCRPDLSDLAVTVERLLADGRLRRRVARQGRRDFLAWASDWRSHLLNGIENHVREALGLARRPASSQAVTAQPNA